MTRLIRFTLAALLIASAAQAAEKLTPADMTEIQMLYSRYAFAYDIGNKEMYGGVFTDDGLFKIGTDRTLRGPKEIATLISSELRERPKIFHLTTNILIDAAPEGAKGTCYVALIDLQKNPAITGGGVYEDIIVKTEAGWRFQQRTYYAEPGPTTPTATPSAR
jgi:hypothetical protein